MAAKSVGRARGRAELDVVDDIPEKYLQRNGGYEMAPRRVTG
ncbi:hypothetical protein AB0D86_28535 [Streptomyces sp. NPDC048324]